MSLILIIWKTSFFFKCENDNLIQNQCFLLLRLSGFAKKKCFGLKGPHWTSNFDHQSLIRLYLNYTEGSFNNYVDQILPNFTKF